MFYLFSESTHNYAYLAHNQGNQNSVDEASKTQIVTNDEIVRSLESVHQHDISSKRIPPPVHNNRRNKTKMSYRKSQKKRSKTRYTTGYGIFFREKHSKVRKADPSIEFGTLSKTISAMWRHMDDEDRKRYEKRVDRHPYSTDYGLFFREHYKNIKTMNPNASFGEISKIAATMWKSSRPQNDNRRKCKRDI